MVSILFVCLGNICRSPAAEGIMKHHVNNDPSGLEIHIESCGLGDWHVGNLPDPRMRDVAKNRGLILSSRAQEFKLSFFDRFDHILAADHKIMKELYERTTNPEHKAKIHLITHYSVTYKDQEIPDPYYGGEAGFENVLNMIDDACLSILDHLKKQIR